MNYKSIIIAIAAIAMSVTANAQKGDKAVGANLSFAPRPYIELLGVGAKFRHNVSKPFRLESSFNYLFEKDFVTRWDFFVNGHFLISITDRMKIYPLLGFGYLGNKANYPVTVYENEWGVHSFGGKKSSNKGGWSLGAGVDYKITDKLIFNAEFNHKAECKLDIEVEYACFFIGLLYRF